MVAARRAAARPALRPDEEAHDILAAEEFGVPAPDPALRREEAHDVLAAEEFGMPAPDPALHREQAHDVLAAEEFAMPAPSLHPGPVMLPDDPTGIPEPHDVLAAEEFALPAPPLACHSSEPAAGRRAERAGLIVVGAALVLLARRTLRARR